MQLKLTEFDAKLLQQLRPLHRELYRDEPDEAYKRPTNEELVSYALNHYVHFLRELMEKREPKPVEAEEVSPRRVANNPGMIWDERAQEWKRIDATEEPKKEVGSSQ